MRNFSFLLLQNFWIFMLLLMLYYIHSSIPTHVIHTPTRARNAKPKFKLKLKLKLKLQPLLTSLDVNSYKFLVANAAYHVQRGDKTRPTKKKMPAPRSPFPSQAPFHVNPFMYIFSPFSANPSRPPETGKAPQTPTPHLPEERENRRCSSKVVDPKVRKLRPNAIAAQDRRSNIR